MSRNKGKPKRPPESYRGRTARARAPQAANLVPGGNPAGPGNEIAKRHGAYGRVDPLRLDRQVRLLLRVLEDDPPLRDPDGDVPRHDRLMLELLARCLVRLGDVSHSVSMHGLLGPDGKPRPVVALEGELRREAASLAEALAMSPTSRARAGVDIAAAGALLTGDGVPPRDESLDRDPDVRAANRELVRAFGRARARELADGAPIDADADEVAARDDPPVVEDD